MSVSEVEQLRRQLRELEKYFIEYRNQNGADMSHLATWALGIQKAIDEMKRTLSEIARGAKK